MRAQQQCVHSTALNTHAQQTALLPSPSQHYAAFHPQLSGAPWSEAIETQLCYEIKTFLLAGHETSAAMLMWSMFELSEHPEALAKVSEVCLCVLASAFGCRGAGWNDFVCA